MEEAEQLEEAAQLEEAEQLELSIGQVQVSAQPMSSSSGNAQQVIARLLTAAAAGDMKLQVDRIEGFAVDDEIEIVDPASGTREAHAIDAFSSILLKKPLQANFGAGSTISHREQWEEATIKTSAELAAAAKAAEDEDEAAAAKVTELVPAVTNAVLAGAVDAAQSSASVEEAVTSEVVEELAAIAQPDESTELAVDLSALNDNNQLDAAAETKDAAAEAEELSFKLEDAHSLKVTDLILNKVSAHSTPVREYLTIFLTSLLSAGTRN